MSLASDRFSPRARGAGALALACLLAAGCRQKAPAAPAADVAASLAAIVATCAAAVGDVEVKRAGRETWTPVTTGAVLRVGDTIRTLPGGFARVEFLSGNGIELEERTTAVVDLTPQVVAAAPSPASDRVAVEGGVARGFFADKAGVPTGPIVIRTPDGKEARLAPAGGARGVRFRLTATATGTEIAITSGSASIVGPSGELALAEGSAVELAREGLGAPIELIPFPESLAPNVDARVRLAPGLTVALTWTRVEGATGYRVQIARDLSFREISLARQVEDPSFAFAPEQEGMYAWRVAARDRAGRYGEYGFARRLYCDAAPRRDLLVAPASDAVVRGGPRSVRFAWQPQGAGRGYRLVVASSPDLTERQVRSASTTAASVDLPGLAPGVYYWGVYVDDERRDPIFVKPRRLVVERPQPPRVRVPRAIREWGS